MEERFFQLLDAELVSRLAQTVIIAGTALMLFFGLKGRIQRFAEWARLPRLALTPVRLGLRYAILGGALLLILGRWGFPINGIIAFLGTVLGLVAIGFVAVWSVLSNFLCTFVLVVLKPFHPGDDVELPTAGIKGRVLDLTAVYTVIETADGETAMVPNNMFFQMIFKRRMSPAAPAVRGGSPVRP